MDHSEQEILKNYAANENILRSENATPSEKANAWRKQGLLLHQLKRNSSEEVFFRAMKKHFDKLNVEATDQYLDQRAANVNLLIQNHVRRTDEVMEMPEIPEDLFEPACHGRYESCQHNEVTPKLLEVFRKPQQQAQLPLHPFFSKRIDRNISNTDESSARARNNNSTTTSVPAPAQNIVNGQHGFRTAREELMLQNSNKAVEHAPERTRKEAPTTIVPMMFGSRMQQKSVEHAPEKTRKEEPTAVVPMSYGLVKKSLGGRRGVHSNFTPPVRNTDVAPPNLSDSAPTCSPKMSNIDPKMIEIIKSEIMHKYKPVAWDDIAGLDYAKSILMEAVVFPLLRPDIFKGLRRPPRGILLFGPPGTGKTLIGKCIASQSKSTFFSITPSTLTSKWIGDGEKLVKSLFAVAAEHQPAVIFMDEIDSLLSQRSETEHESSRRLKNEFLIQLDGATTTEEERILIIGATNRPQELDEAARRRFVRRLYIPLPELSARIKILTNLLQTVGNELSAADIEEIGRLTEGYSGADMDTLCREAAMEPVRAIPAAEMCVFKEEHVRPIIVQDFHAALKNISSTVSQQDLKQYEEWNNIFGVRRKI